MGNDNYDITIIIMLIVELLSAKFQGIPAQRSFTDLDFLRNGPFCLDLNRRFGRYTFKSSFK